MGISLGIASSRVLTLSSLSNKKNDSVENGKRQNGTRDDEQKSMEFQTWNKVM